MSTGNLFGIFAPVDFNSGISSFQLKLLDILLLFAPQILPFMTRLRLFAPQILPCMARLRLFAPPILSYIGAIIRIRAITRLIYGVITSIPANPPLGG